MKKVLVIVNFMLAVSLSSVASEFVIENHLGINCLKHTVDKGETFYKVAQKYFVRPSTLAVVNNIDNIELVSEGVQLFIPLTETNFYNTKGLEGSKFTFKPVHYEIQNETKLSELADLFFVSVVSIKEWNSKNLPLRRGDKIIVGWVKFEREMGKQKVPLFVQNEKFVYGNAEEKAEARKELVALDASSPVSSFPDYSIPTNVVPQLKQNKSRNTKRIKNGSEVASKAKKESAVTYSEDNKKIIEKVPDKTIENKKELKSDPVAVEQEVVVSKKPVEKITKAESDYLKGKVKKARQKKKSKFISKVRKITKNSYSRDKNKGKETNRIESKKIVEKPVVKQVVKKANVLTVKTDEVEVKNEVINKTYTSPPVDTIKKEPASEPLYVQNKLQRLTLLKSMKGRVSFFYSGAAGVKFYVFTNLATKGDIIKLTHLGNKKYILAKVIGPLSEADRKKGYVISLSDNSRRLIGVKSKSFAAKVNY